AALRPLNSANHKAPSGPVVIVSGELAATENSEITGGVIRPILFVANSVNQIKPSPRAAARGGGRAQVPGQAFEPQGGARPFVGRTLLGRWHASRGLSVDEELSRQGRFK